MESHKLSFVIPCYNSEKTIGTVVEEIVDIVSKSTNMRYEIILVNDYSSDETWNVIKSIAKNFSNVIGINFSKNFGQHSALMAGYAKAEGDLIVSLDDDGQTPINGLWEMIKKIDDERLDVVYAITPVIQQDTFRRVGTFIHDIMLRLIINKPKNLKLTSFAVMRKFVVEEIIQYQNSYPHISGLVLRTTAKIGTVVVQQRKRLFGESNYNFCRLFALWMNAFTAFSIIPLRIASFWGIFCASGAFIYGIYILVMKIFHPEIPLGYSSMICVILFMGGLIMMMLGLIGEYVGRSYLSLNNTPQYVIKDIVRSNEEMEGK